MRRPLLYFRFRLPVARRRGGEEPVGVQPRVIDVQLRVRGLAARSCDSEKENAGCQFAGKDAKALNSLKLAFHVCGMQCAVCECRVTFLLQICEGTSPFMVTLYCFRICLNTNRSLRQSVHSIHIHICLCIHNRIRISEIY